MSEQEAPQPAESTTPSASVPAPSADAAASAAIKAANDAVAKARSASAAAGAESAAATATAVAVAPGPGVRPGAQPFPLGDFAKGGSGAESGPIDLLSDVTLNVKIELGRTRMLVEDVLRLSDGTVVELDKIAGDPVDVYVNDRLVARGEVLVLNDNFCVRISEIVTNQLQDSK